MKVQGTYTFPAHAEQVWDLLMDPHALMQIVPGLQTVQVKPDGEIVFDANLGLGPVRGTFCGNVHLLDQQRPTHVRIVGEGKGSVGSVRGTCDVHTQDQGDTTRIDYEADVRMGGALKGVGEPFLKRAMDVVMRRSFERLQRACPAGGGNGPDGESSSLSKTTQVWDEMNQAEVRQVAWSSLAELSQWYANEFSGSEPGNLYIHRLLAERLGERRVGLRGAALVCGDMAAERGYFETDSICKFAEVDGFDISSVSLSKYKPQDLQFNSRVTDCNNFVLDPGAYDLVVTCFGAHHVYNLGNFFYQAAKSLNRGGLFYMIEWVGPTFLQIPRSNHLVASALLLSMFDRRTRTTHVGQVKGRWIQYPPAALEPSEACNSTELVPQFCKYFQPIKMTFFAGLAYPIFEGIAQNLNQSDPGVRRKIRTVYEIEKLLMRLRVIKPLFAMAVGAKRDGIF